MNALSQIRCIRLSLNDKWNDDKLNFSASYLENLIKLEIDWDESCGFDSKKLCCFLSRCPKLKHFHFCGNVLNYTHPNGIADEAFLPLQFAHDLETLVWECVKLGEQIGHIDKILRGKKKLKTLRLCYISFDQDRHPISSKIKSISAEIGNLYNIRVLDISGSHLNFHKFDAHVIFSELRGLVRLRISDPSDISLAAVSHYCPKLDFLGIYGGCNRFTLEGLLGVLRSCPIRSLCTLGVFGSGIDASDLKRICTEGRQSLLQVQIGPRRYRPFDLRVILMREAVEEASEGRVQLIVR